MRLIIFLATLIITCALLSSISFADGTYISSCGLNKQVSAALTHQSPELRGANFRKTIVVFPYALQPWTDEEVGGVALLKYNQTKGWVLVLGGGGWMDISTLLRNHVPRNKAAQLMMELNNC